MGKMNSHDDLMNARDIAWFGHKDQLDKGGNPYYIHLVSVMTGVWTTFDFDKTDYDYLIVAILHDFLEDVDNSESTILHFRHVFGDDVVDALIAITKIKGEKRSDYLKRVCDNRIACLVKYYDTKDNMNLSRLKEITQKDISRCQIYSSNLETIKSRLVEYGFSVN